MKRVDIGGDSHERNGMRFKNTELQDIEWGGGGGGQGVL